MVRAVVVLVCILVARQTALAQDDAPAPQNLPGPPETPAENWDELVPPEAPPAPPPPPAPVAHAEAAAAVARDAYLGGDGVVGPLALVSGVSVASPFVGGLAGAWAGQETHPRLSGQYVRGVVAALTRVSVVAVVGGLGLGLAIVPAIVIGGTAALAAWFYGWASVITLIYVGGSIPNMAGWLMFAYGGYVAGLGVAYVLTSLVYWLPLMLASRLGVAAGDAVWDNLFVTRGVEKKHERGGVVGSRLPGERPLNVVLAGALMSAAYSGVLARRAWLEPLPIIGPALADISIGDNGADRMEQARLVAGYQGGNDLSVLARSMNVVEAVFRTVGSPALLLSGVTFALFGGGVALTGLSFTTPAVTGSLPLGLGLLGGSVVIGALSAISVAAVLAASSLHLVAPWVLAFHGLWSAEEIPQAAVPDEN